MDALGIERAVVAGFDWGVRTADIVAAGVGLSVVDPIPALLVAALAAKESVELWHGEGDDCCAPVGFGDPDGDGCCDSGCECC
jgi:hypothetical protein